MSIDSSKIRSIRSIPRVKFPKQTILFIVSELEEGLSKSEACLKYGMCSSTLTSWMKRFGSGKNKRIQLTGQQRREVARAITEGRMTVKEAQLAHPFHAAHTIRGWVRELKKQNVELTQSNQPTMPSSTTSDDQLQQKLTNAELKIAALETMIDIAEQQFKISIRKKPGAKQS